MRVWRRIVGKPRYKRVSMSDVDVRSRLCIPSLDCLMRKKRLKYLARLAVSDVWPLRASLQLRGPNGELPPWVKLICEDLQVLFAAVPSVFADLPTPDVDPAPLWELLTNYRKEWQLIVEKYHTIYDDPIRCSDRSRVGDGCWGTGVPAAVTAFNCTVCWKDFPSQKSLDQHARNQHGERRGVDEHVGDWRQCPVCMTTFAARAGLIAHLSEKRCRSKLRPFCCGQVFADSNPPRVPDAELAKLQAADREAKRIAGKQGHTHVLARKPAKVGKRGAAIVVPYACLYPVKRVSAKRAPTWGPDFRCDFRKLLAVRACERSATEATHAVSSELCARNTSRVRYRLTRKTSPSTALASTRPTESTNKNGS